MSDDEGQRETERIDKLTRLHLIKDLELLQLKGVHPDPIAKQLMNGKAYTNREFLVRRVMNSLSNRTTSKK